MKLVGIKKDELIVLNATTVNEAKELPKAYILHEEIASNYYIKVV